MIAQEPSHPLSPTAERSLTFPRRHGESLAQLVARLDAALTERAGVVLKLTAIIAPGEQPVLAESLGGRAVPLTVLLGGGDGLGGLQAEVISGAPVERLTLDGQVVGSVWADDGARWVVLAGLVASDPTAPEAVQCREVFERIETAVGLAGLSFDHVVRTWLYEDRILDWYGDLNRVRSQFFREHGTFDKVVPASTGIGVANGSGHAMVAEAIALDRGPGTVGPTPLPSPLQCAALEYGSAFSRALEVGNGGVTRLWISGTASIAPGGATMHLGDVPGQIDRTVAVLEAILVSQGFGWHEASRGIAYCINAGVAEQWRAYAATNGYAELPFLTAICDICRDDLLFEIEVDAQRLGVC